MYFTNCVTRLESSTGVGDSCNANLTLGDIANLEAHSEDSNDITENIVVQELEISIDKHKQLPKNHKDEVPKNLQS